MKKSQIISIIAVVVVFISIIVNIADKNSKIISKESFGGNWPFSVDSGLLRCEHTYVHSSVLFETNNKVYAVNDSAMAAKRYEDIDEIWLGNTQPYSPKISIGPIIQEGLKLCE